jgi:N-carbamoyl-L-amino-acid hydrolase
MAMLQSRTNDILETEDGGSGKVLTDIAIVRAPILESKQLQVNEARLWNEIMETASLGGIPGTTGMNRLALSESDREIRNYFVKQARSIGCHITVDTIGNIFAILPGLDGTLPPIGIGSHLDTQPNGKTMQSSWTILN